MNPSARPESEIEHRTAVPLWDTLIRIGLLAGLGYLCFMALSPFLKLMAWSIILAITMYPMHQWLARKIGGKQGLTSTILVILGISLLVVPTWLLVNSFADSIHDFVGAVQN